jgi:hypothetical protein
MRDTFGRIILNNVDFGYFSLIEIKFFCWLLLINMTGESTSFAIIFSSQLIKLTHYKYKKSEEFELQILISPITSLVVIYIICQMKVYVGKEALEKYIKNEVKWCEIVLTQFEFVIWSHFYNYFLIFVNLFINLN